MNDSVIYIRLKESDKKLLEKKARQIGLTLTAYCRMLLLENIKDYWKEIK